MKYCLNSTEKSVPEKNMYVIVVYSNGARAPSLVSFSGCGFLMPVRILPNPHDSYQKNKKKKFLCGATTVRWCYPYSEMCKIVATQWEKYLMGKIFILQIMAVPHMFLCSPNAGPGGKRDAQPARAAIRARAFLRDTGAFS